MARRFTIAAAMTAVALTTILNAAYFWTTKPYANWTDKERQKLVTNSPWVWQMGIDNGTPGTPSAIVTLLWQSALPVKRAMYGPGESTDQNSKALLDRVEPYYLLHMSGVPNSYRAKMDINKLKAATTLKVKGREPLHPSEVQIFEAAPTPLTQQAPPAPLVIHQLPIIVKNFQASGTAPILVSQSTDVYFAFPKSAGIKVEDQEMEFETNVGGLILKRKFKLKDMVYEGKLEI
jgi:hypothetical protein